MKLSLESDMTETVNATPTAGSDKLSKVSLSDRTSLNGHAPAVLWFTGLSGSGKSTVANAVEVKLHQRYAGGAGREYPPYRRSGPAVL